MRGESISCCESIRYFYYEKHARREKSGIFDQALVLDLGMCPKFTDSPGFIPVD